MLDQVRKWLEPAAAGSPGGFLRPIDTRLIARELKVEEAARKDGENEYPASATATLSSTENGIIQRLESEWQWQGGTLTNELTAYGERLAAYSIASEAARISLTANEALAALREAQLRAAHELKPLLEAYKALTAELAHFRASHKLARIARSPSSRWISGGLLFVLIAIESVLNGAFFASGSAYGLIGGIGTAIGISFANVCFGFATGLLPLRWINHRSLVIKLVGLCVGTACIAVLVALHALAVHLREATLHDVAESQLLIAAKESLLARPFEVSDINSVYLFALGIILAAISIWKGSTFDDPYPGYGAHARRAERARQTYVDEHHDIFDELEEIKDSALRQLEGGIRQLPLYPQQAAGVLAQRNALLRTFKGYESSVESSANELLSLYRRMNSAARKTPPPATFEKSWQLPFTYASAEPTTNEGGGVSRAELEAKLEEFRRLTAEILSEYERLLTIYPEHVAG